MPTDAPSFRLAAAALRSDRFRIIQSSPDARAQLYAVTIRPIDTNVLGKPMLDQARHVPFLPVPWNASEAATAIEQIVSDALEHFNAERFWPAHPLDEGVSDGHTSLYCGA